MKRSRPEGYSISTLAATARSRGDPRQTVKELRSSSAGLRDDPPAALAAQRHAAQMDRRPTDRSRRLRIHQAQRPSHLASSASRSTTSNTGFACSIAFTTIIPACGPSSAKRNSAGCASPIWTRYPSTSFTLRNLGDRLLDFLAERPDLIAGTTRDVSRHGKI